MIRPPYLCFGIFAIAIFLEACSGNDEPSAFDCTTSDLAVTLIDSTNPTDCTSGDGSITVSGTGGKQPYKFALNTGVFGNAAEFINLSAGDYTIRVKDRNGCESFVDISLQLPGADPLTAEVTLTPDTECFTNNGVIEIIASGGQEPYQYKLGNGAFGTETIFEGKAPGNYAVSVKDALNCVFVKSVTLAKGNSETSLTLDIKPIIDANCAVQDCHAGSESPDLRTKAAIVTHAVNIKKLTQSGEMPREGSLTAEQKALIACWVDEGAENN
jgi:SprB repeat